MSYTAGSVMDSAAAVLNDTAKNIFTYVAQIPYLNLAIKEMQQKFEENNVPLTNAVSSALVIPVGTTSISFSSSPALPASLIEIQGMYERLNGSNDDYIPVQRVEFLPLLAEIIDELVYFTWQNQIIQTLGALTDRQIKLNYISAVIPLVTASSDTLTAINAELYLAYKTAALCSMYIGENSSRAEALNSQATDMLDVLINISSRGRQAFPARRRPFQAAYRSWGDF